MQIPIACSLEADAARSQIGEWQDLVRRVVDGSTRVSPNRLELDLLPNADIEPVISLAQREVACCSFFTFTVRVLTQRLVLVVEVPDGAEGILDQLALGAL